jgi:hypothetical protein
VDNVVSKETGASSLPTIMLHDAAVYLVDGGMALRMPDTIYAKE